MLINIYENAVNTGKIQESIIQKNALSIMEKSFLALNRHKILQWFYYYKQYKYGVYLYGTVGVGKTYIADLFYDNSKVPKERLHFFNFMQVVQEQLQIYKGQKNPLDKIAKNIAKKIKLLFLDELMVYDIADAMIIGELLKNLRKNKVFILITSNIAPKNLYINGLQRKRFLSLIKFINTDFDIINCSADYDYRLHKKHLHQLYWCPCSKSNLNSMQALFKKNNNNIIKNSNILIQKRYIATKYLADRFIWFDFDALCNIPRCSLDYIEIASKFDCIFLSTVPIFIENKAPQLIFFMQLIDVLYDKKIPIVICAEASIDNLYNDGQFAAQFQRTKSRLHEMQSIDYV